MCCSVRLARNRRPRRGHGRSEARAQRVCRKKPQAILAAASKVVIVPGYGMAVAQAQHKVRELYDALTKTRVDVKFGIHPVAAACRAT